MKFSATSILLFHTVAAASLRQQTTSSCCFQLSSVGDLNSAVEEDHAGDLLAGGEFQDARFCLDSGTSAITDNLGGTCLFKAPNQQFGCFKGRGPLVPFGIAPSMNERSYLTYGNGTKSFHACPAGSANDQSYYIYGDNKPDKTGCFEINLQLKNQTVGCHARNSTVINTASTITLQLMTMTSTPARRWETRIKPTNSLATQIDIAQAVATSASEETSVPSQTCKIAPSAPSLPPVMVGNPDTKAPDGIRDSAAEVSISADNSTIFQYSIPASFVPANESSGASGAQRRLCALQFRMPFCSDLPKGYPCYHFSGLEQEMLADSGMNFALATDDDDGAATVAWDDKKLHKITPGEDIIVGTFECGALPSNDTPNVDGGRKIVWRATSVRDFSLEFLQAGIGDRPRFQDGIGAWIVPCL